MHSARVCASARPGPAPPTQFWVDPEVAPRSEIFHYGKGVTGKQQHSLWHHLCCFLTHREDGIPKKG